VPGVPKILAIIANRQILHQATYHHYINKYSTSIIIHIYFFLEKKTIRKAQIQEIDNIIAIDMHVIIFRSVKLNLKDLIILFLKYE